MSYHPRPSRGLQCPTATHRPLTGSRLKAAELLSSLAQDDLVRPELRNDVLLSGERPPYPGRTSTDQHRRREREYRDARFGDGDT
ncbi:hypothetical protein [Halomonas stenophila]|uniref:Uncharacterized protein n=1 Tax=Halomonas stenophila TaxID=795312 RepID=A0A7W5HMJ7_9GAMM|nr:hypothetical protein [Halomonas stenophila]MBB3232509.1 hypothetical protein [Halomonas stenophila]